MSSTNLPGDTNYELPGDLANPIALRSRHKMLQAAYSRRLNPRLMEYIFYAPWSHLFSSLVHDIPRIFVVPQHVIYRERDHDPSTDSSDTISAKTKPQTNLDSRTPDFGFLSAKEAFVPTVSNNDTPPWDEISIEFPFVCLLSEIKRPPSRSTPEPNDFTIKLEGQLFSAMSDLYAVAAIVFADKKRKYQPDSIILIAVAGEWYKWTELSRHHLPTPKRLPRNWFQNAWPPRDAHLKNRPSANRSKSEDEEDLNSVQDVHDVGKVDEEQEQQEDDDDGNLSSTSEVESDTSDPHSQWHDDSDKSEYSDEEPEPDTQTLVTEYHHHILEHPDLEMGDQYQLPSMNREGAMEVAKASWTGIIRLGTPVSNQHLSAIHKRLVEIEPEYPAQEAENNNEGNGGPV